MNLDRFVRDYSRTAENLPGVLQQWKTLAPDLRSHYADELALLFADRVEAMGVLADVSALQFFRLAWTDAQMIAMRREIMEATGVDPLDFILPAATTDARASESMAPALEADFAYRRPALAA